MLTLWHAKKTTVDITASYTFVGNLVYKKEVILSLRHFYMLHMQYSCLSQSPALIKYMHQGHLLWIDKYV